MPWTVYEKSLSKWITQPDFEGLEDDEAPTLNEMRKMAIVLLNDDTFGKERSRRRIEKENRQSRFNTWVRGLPGIRDRLEEGASMDSIKEVFGKWIGHPPHPSKDASDS